MRKLVAALLTVTILAVFGVSALVYADKRLGNLIIGGGEQAPVSTAPSSSVSSPGAQPEAAPAAKKLYTLASGEGDELSKPQLYEQFGKAVALVYTDDFSGSGVFISSSGFLLTNYHVIDGASYCRVLIAGQDEGSLAEGVRAEIVAADKDRDLALLQIEGASGFPFVELCPFDIIATGQEVCAIGNPRNLSLSLTGGTLSSVRPLGSSVFGGAFGDGFGSILQTDALIDHGSSGGALLNMRGELLGVTTFMLSNTGFGFAMASDCIKDFVGNYHLYPFEPDATPPTPAALSKIPKDGYILPQSGERPLQKSELEKLDPELLRYALCEIFARHGQVFMMPKYENYFLSRSWYVAQKHFSPDVLSDAELQNAALIEKLLASA